MKRTQGVFHYWLTHTEGVLSGGTTPTWSVAAAVPIATHINVQADNETLLDSDTDLLQEYAKMTGYFPTPDGLNFIVFLADVNHTNSEEIDATVFPSWVHSQVILSVTYTTLAIATAGTPTGTPFTLDITEEDCPRSSVTFRPLRIKRLQTTVSEALISDSVNDNTTLIAQTGAYKCILFKNQTNTNNTDITKIQVYINDVALNMDTSWLQMQKAEQILFNPNIPTAGYALMNWQRGQDLSQLFNVANTQVVTSVNVKITNHPAAATSLKCLRMLYV